MKAGFFRADLLLPKHKPGCLLLGLFSGDFSPRADLGLGLAGWLLWRRSQSSVRLTWGWDELSAVTGVLGEKPVVDFEAA